MIKYRGFSLVEFLVVVAIISILAAILLAGISASHHQYPPCPFNLGDVVVMNGINVTGVVSYIYDDRRVDITVKDDHGLPKDITYVASQLLTKTTR
jgi:prepilin-type N-terminal cleavage/methylation domain-containing protein